MNNLVGTNQCDHLLVQWGQCRFINICYATENSKLMPGIQNSSNHPDVNKLTLIGTHSAHSLKFWYESKVGEEESVLWH